MNHGGPFQNSTPLPTLSRFSLAINAPISSETAPSPQQYVPVSAASPYPASSYSIFGVHLLCEAKHLWHLLGGGDGDRVRSAGLTPAQL